MPDLLAGARVTAGDFPRAVSVVSNGNSGNFTSEAPLASFGEAGVLDLTFVAPTTERVEVLWGGGITADGTNVGYERGFLEFEIYHGTSTGGTLIYPADVTSRRWAVGGRNGRAIFGGRSRVLDGFIPYEKYYARIMMQRAGDTFGTVVVFHQRVLEVVPVT